MRTLLLLTLLNTVAYGQTGDIDLAKIKFKGLDFISTKEEIIKSIGQPKIVNSTYECGGFANDQPGGPYYLLDYNEFNYIGSDKETFTLHNVIFDPKGVTKLHLDDNDLSGLTTKSAFIKIVGDTAKKYFQKNPDADSILLYFKDSDDGVVFTFKDNRLIEFLYWTPC